MDTNGKSNPSWREWLSPLKITLLAINAVCLGGCIVLLAVGRGGGPLILLTIATGLSFGAGLTGAIMASRQDHNRGR
jgi:hypothetical protein